MQNPKCKMRNNAAFSLIEVIFAMVFLMVIIFGVVTLQSSNLALINTQKNEIQAHFLTNQGLQIADVIGYTAINTPACSECMLQLVGQNYSATEKGGSDGEEIPAVPPSPIFNRFFDAENTLANALVITMKVDWADSTGSHTVSAKRVIY